MCTEKGLGQSSASGCDKIAPGCDTPARAGKELSQPIRRKVENLSFNNRGAILQSTIMDPKAGFETHEDLLRRAGQPLQAWELVGNTPLLALRNISPGRAGVE